MLHQHTLIHIAQRDGLRGGGLAWVQDATGNDVAEIDKVAIFSTVVPNLNYHIGAQTIIEDDSEHMVTRAGGFITTRFPARRRLDIEFKGQDESNANVLMHIMEKTKKEGDLFIIANPLFTGFSKYISSSIFRRFGNVTNTESSFGLHDLGFSLREN